MSEVQFRQAVPADAAQCIVLRGQTRENAVSVEELRALGITVESWSAGIAAGDFPGYIADMNGEMAGYCFGDRQTGEVLVLALLPQYEGQGIGKALLHLMVNQFKADGFKRLFLGCSPDPAVRSYGFYRHLGWASTGKTDAGGDEVLELWL